MRVTTITALLMALATLLSLGGGIAFAAAYGTAVLPLFVATLFYCRGLATLDRLCTYVLVVFLWSFYLLRPIFLLTDLEFYKFGVLIGDVIAVHVRTLYWLALLNTISLVVAIVILRTFLRVPSGMLLPGTLLARLPSGLFIGALMIMTLYFLASLLGAMGSDSGRTGVRVLELVAFVRISIPVMVAFLIARSAGGGDTRQRTLMAAAAVLLYSGALFLQGSKLFVIEFVVLFFIFTLVFRGDLRLSTARILGYGALSIVVVLSFPIAMAVRRLTGEMGLAGLSPGLIVDRLDFMASFATGRSIWLFPVDLLTRRLNGYDGLIAAMDQVSFAGLEAFSVSTVLTNAIAGLVPGVLQGGGSLGQLTSQLFYGFAPEDDIAHAGGIGHFGMLRLFGGRDLLDFIGGTAVFTVIWSSAFVVCCRVLSNPLLRLALFGSLVMISALCLTGGNFDRVLQETMVAFLHAFVLSAVIVFRPPQRVLRETVH